MMNRYLKKICKELGLILKRQRGNQYGFGDEIDSSQDIRKNMSEDMLNDPDANHTKSIENLFGNLDREIRKSGPKGFEKVASDLVIKYSKDLIGTEHLWHKKENRRVAQEINIKQTKFDKQQKYLASKGLDIQDASNLCTANKVLKCIADCQKSHNGPLMDIESLETLLSKFKDEKNLHKALNLEIRFRKFTLTEVKSTCPLFRQKGLTVEEKMTNLKALISSQLDFKALADMEDLEDAINKADIDSAEVIQKDDHAEAVHNVVERDTLLNHGISKNEFVLAMFEDGPYPGEVIDFTEDNVTINFLEPATVNRQRSMKYWKWPNMTD